MADSISTRLHVTGVEMKLASAAHNEAGLIAWIAITLNDALRVDGLTLRRTLGGRTTLSFPARTDASGLQHPVFRPLDEEIRRDIQDQVFRRLGIRQEER